MRRQFLSPVKGAMLILLLIVSTVSWANEIDWAQPPVRCIENLVHRVPKDCAHPNGDSRVIEMCNVLHDFKTLSQKSKKYADARNQVFGAQDVDDKVRLIYENANRVGMPPQILVGALLQESELADLGLSVDESNYSCSLAQFNVGIWCQWAMQADPQVQAKLDWPSDLIQRYSQSSGAQPSELCGESFLIPKHAAPFYRAAVSRMNGERPELMTGEQLKGIERGLVDTAMNIVTSQFNSKASPDDRIDDSPLARDLRYAILHTFTEHCTQAEFAISVMASVLGKNFQSLPEGLRNVQIYEHEDAFLKKCSFEPRSRAYPLHPGWLLSDVMYNGGNEIATEVVRRWTLKKGQDWSEFNVIELQKILDDMEKDPKLQKEIGIRVLHEAAGHARKVVRRVTMPGAIDLLHHN